jgi:hypothetical protein
MPSPADANMTGDDIAYALSHPVNVRAHGTLAGTTSTTFVHPLVDHFGYGVELFNYAWTKSWRRRSMYHKVRLISKENK